MNIQDNDWKAALAKAMNLEVAEPEQPAEASAQPARRKRSGVVFSTNPDYAYATDDEAEVTTLPRQQQRLRVSMERAGRGGKTVTIVRGFVGTDDDLQALGRLLKQRCGVGGSAKDGEIIIQGDRRPAVVSLLKAEGYTQTK